MKKFTVSIVMAILSVATVSAPALAAQMTASHARTMHKMAREPHHMLAMAYKDNLVAFAKTLRLPAGQPEAVNPVLARAAVAEMRRSFGLMKQHCQDQMMTMNADTKTQMAKMMQQMDTKIMAIGDQLAALEREISYSTLDAKKISGIAGKIIHECDQMAKMHIPARNTARGHSGH